MKQVAKELWKQAKAQADIMFPKYLEDMVNETGMQIQGDATKKALYVTFANGIYIGLMAKIDLMVVGDETDKS